MAIVHSCAIYYIFSSMIRISDNTHCGLMLCIISKYGFGITPQSLFHVLSQMDAKNLESHDAASGSLLASTSLASASDLPQP